MVESPPHLVSVSEIVVLRRVEVLLCPIDTQLASQVFLTILTAQGHRHDLEGEAGVEIGTLTIIGGIGNGHGSDRDTGQGGARVRGRAKGGARDLGRATDTAQGDLDHVDTLPIKIRRNHFFLNFIFELFLTSLSP